MQNIDSRGSECPEPYANDSVETHPEGEVEPMRRRRGRIIGTFIIGTCMLLLFAQPLIGDRLRWRADGLSVMKADMTPAAERALSLGTTVLARDGTVVGKVSGLSRDARGHVERIRVTGPIPMGLGQRILIIQNVHFRVEEQAVRLSLSIAELEKMPRAMTEDIAADRPG